MRSNRNSLWMVVLLLVAFLVIVSGYPRRGLPGPGVPTAARQIAPSAAPARSPTAKGTGLLAHSLGNPVTNSFPPLLSVARDPRHPNRLSNTQKSQYALLRSPTSVLLRNAEIETAEGTALPIPAHLRSNGDPGSYVVQARGTTDDAFRRQLADSGATIVSYIPNNAWLVEASSDVAQKLASMPRTQSVLPFEPYYKLDEQLLDLAVNQSPVPEGRWINVVIFPDKRSQAQDELRQLGATIVAQSGSPFGPVLTIQPDSASLVALAQSSSVMEMEVYHPRQTSTDLTRARVTVAADPVTAVNYLGLTGSNVVVGVTDSGIDTNHPDLAGRFINVASFLSPDNDSSGHGTFVSGVIAGTGANSSTVVGASGSSNPGVPGQYRGMAPGAVVYPLAALTIIPVAPQTNSVLSDTDLQTNYAGAGVRIVNNSWNYLSFSYDIAAASYDAATRDSWPDSPGSQAILYVFSAGNEGFGQDDGTSGSPDSILSPGTAKDVITVGSIESDREITNDVTILINGTNTVFPSGFLPATDSSNQVSSFSSRGNVGPGIEGDDGRWKPDLVTPGSMTISLRSANYVADHVLGIDSIDPFLATFSTNGGSTNLLYRYESGTSVSAPVVSGMLALMQEYFTTTFTATNSPALNKALLINGARSIGPDYSYSIAGINYQGWGLPFLTNSIVTNMAYLTNASIPNAGTIMVEQSLTNCLATGEEHAYHLVLGDDATNYPFRITLAWTDPPGNPVAGVKLVNDLDLILINNTNGEVFMGNDFGGGFDFTVAQPFLTNDVSYETISGDVLNNVENIYMAPNFTVNDAPVINDWTLIVRAKRVNVNARTDYPNKIVQDYALVISTERPDLTSLISLDVPVVTTNTRAPVTVFNGNILNNQVVGANYQISTNAAGDTNQWNFYFFVNADPGQQFTTNLQVLGDQIITNITPLNLNTDFGPYVVFATFLPPNLGIPRNKEADIDMYVTRSSGLESYFVPFDFLVTLDPSLIDLQPGLGGADRSVGRYGTEAVFFTNAQPGEVFCVAIKSEDQQAGQFSFAAVSSSTAFSKQNADGTTSINMLALPQQIPDGTAEKPSGITVLGICTTQTNVSQISVTNFFFHENIGDLVGTLGHEGNTGNINVTLNNHYTDTSNNGGLSPYFFTYDDSLNPAMGPGGLDAYKGAQAFGLWTFTVIDDAEGHVGSLQAMEVKVHPETNNSPLNIRSITLAPGECFLDFVDLPVNATNLGIVFMNGSAGDVDVGGRRTTLLPPGGSNDFETNIDIPPSFGTNVLLTTSTTPPISPGIEYIELCNDTTGTITLVYNFDVEIDLTANQFSDLVSPFPISLPDDATTNSTIVNPNNLVVASLEVGIQIKHDRVSDLDITLYHDFVDPFTGLNRTDQVKLFENRGGWTNGLEFLPPFVPPGAGEIEANGWATNLYVNFTEDTNKTTTLVFEFGDDFDGDEFINLPNLLPIKQVTGFYTNALLPPQLLNVNWFTNTGYLPNGTALLDFANVGACIIGQTLIIPGIVRTNGGAPNDSDTDGTASFLTLPILSQSNSIGFYGAPGNTNNLNVTVLQTNWPGLEGIRATNAFAITNGPIGVITQRVGYAVFSNAAALAGDGFYFVGSSSETNVTGDAFAGAGSPIQHGIIVKYPVGGPVGTGINGSLNGTPAFTNLLYTNPFAVPNGVDYYFGIAPNVETDITGVNGSTNYLYVVGGVEFDRQGFPANQTNIFFSLRKFNTDGTICTNTPAVGNFDWAYPTKNDPLGFPQIDPSNPSLGMDVAVMQGQIVVAVGNTNETANPIPGVRSTYQRPHLWAFATNDPSGPIAGGPSFPQVGAYSQSIGSYTRLCIFGTNVYAVGYSVNTSGGLSNRVALVDQWQIFSQAVTNPLTLAVTNVFTATNINRLELDLGTWQFPAAPNNLSGDSAFTAIVQLQGQLYAVGYAATNTISGSTTNWYTNAVMAEIDPTTLTATYTSYFSHNMAITGTENVNTWFQGIATDGDDLYVTGDAQVANTPLAYPEMDAVIYRFKVKNWVQAEESLNTFVGDPALGNWRLEIKDTRVDPVGGFADPPQLVGWDINFIYANTNAIAYSLAPNITYNRFLSAGGIQFFKVTVPAAANFATNLITSTTPVKITYNASGMPQPNMKGNVVLSSSTTSLSVALGANSTPKLIPGQTYYLSVQAVNPKSSANLTAGIYYDQINPPVVATTLTSGVAVSGAIPKSSAVTYYQFTVAAGSSAASFQLSPTAGNLALYVLQSRGSSNIPPSATAYDYQSSTPGASIQSVFVVTNLAPVPLTPGVWYLGVQNLDVKTVPYTIVATQSTGSPYAIATLSSNVTVSGATSAGNAPNTMYKATVASGTTSVLFEALNLNGDGDLILRHASVPSSANYDLRSLGGSLLPEQIVVRTNTIANLTSLAGDWYLGVVNHGTRQLTYSVDARYPTNGMLVGSVPLTSSVPPLTPSALASKQFTLAVDGLSGEQYQIQFKTNLSGTIWTTLTNVIAPAGGVIDVVHTGALTNHSVFYRIIQISH